MNKFMKAAVEQAKIALDNNEVPVGSVIVKNDEIVGVGYNKKNLSNVSVFHAEILAIIDACKNLNTWHLDDCAIYVTLKPCEMCLNALAESRIKKVYYLLDSNYFANLNKNYNNIDLFRLKDSEEYAKMFEKFFVDVRNDVSRET